jgi:hypothetical protein
MKLDNWAKSQRVGWWRAWLDPVTEMLYSRLRVCNTAIAYTYNSSTIGTDKDKSWMCRKKS